MPVSSQTRAAIKHTYHCLIGCGIGEIVGMVIAASLDWGRLGRVSLAILLAFVFGYSLTYFGVRKQTETAGEAVKITLATDSISILSMEVIDTLIELLVPNALMVTPFQVRFWWGLALGLAVAFIVTVPVNRFTMQKMGHAHHH